MGQAVFKEYTFHVIILGKASQVVGITCHSSNRVAAQHGNKLHIKPERA